jgi:pathogenesis-related protein 1
MSKSFEAVRQLVSLSSVAPAASVRRRQAGAGPLGGRRRAAVSVARRLAQASGLLLLLASGQAAAQTLEGAEPVANGGEAVEPVDGVEPGAGAEPVDGAEPGAPVDDASDAAWLEQHNAHRADHCAPPLTWDDELAASAQAWADRCVFEHSGPGENLFANVGTPSAAAAVDEWYSEVAAYDFAAPGFSIGTGHFTQVVWRDTARVGCAVAACPGLFPGFEASLMYVCQYASAGNMAGQFESNVLPSGGTCSE